MEKQEKGAGVTIHRSAGSCLREPPAAPPSDPGEKKAGTLHQSSACSSKPKHLHRVGHLTGLLYILKGVMDK